MSDVKYEGVGWPPSPVRLLSLCIGLLSSGGVYVWNHTLETITARDIAQTNARTKLEERIADLEKQLIQVRIDATSATTNAKNTEALLQEVRSDVKSVLARLRYPR